MSRPGASCLFDEPAPGPWERYLRLRLFPKPTLCARASCSVAWAVRSPPACRPECVHRKRWSWVGEAMQESLRYLPTARARGLTAPLLIDQHRDSRLRPPLIAAPHRTFV